MNLYIDRIRKQKTNFPLIPHRRRFLASERTSTFEKTETHDRTEDVIFTQGQTNVKKKKHQGRVFGDRESLLKCFGAPKSPIKSLAE